MQCYVPCLLSKFWTTFLGFVKCYYCSFCYKWCQSSRWKKHENITSQRPCADCILSLERYDIERVVKYRPPIFSRFFLRLNHLFPETSDPEHS